jgi:superfamily II DNA or RNA helicase
MTDNTFNTLPDRNNTSFPKKVLEALKRVKYDEKDLLKYHQKLVAEYVIKYPQCRGILIQHEMGTGKTITAINIAEHFRGKYDIIILSSKSLQSNFKENIIKYLKMKDPDIKEDKIDNIINEYNFISTKNISTTKRILETKFPQGITKETLDAIKKVGNIDNSVIIIDEAHNFFNGVVNESKTDNELYKFIMNAKNVKIILLTGSPIINTPVELRVAFNIISFRYGKKELFGDTNDEFFETYVDDQNNTIKNKSKFQNRIFGLLSRYNVTKDMKVFFPRKNKFKVIQISMSDYQYGLYADARDKERLETAKRIIKNNKWSQSSSYRSKSRQISNFAYPPHAIDIIEENGIKKKKSDIFKLTDDDFTNIKQYSPKIYTLIKNISNQKGKCVIYSQFINTGIKIISKVLDLKKFEEVKHDVNKPSLRYGIISGEVNIDIRQKIVNIYNDEKNKYGEYIKVLFITATGAEGLDLKAVRHIHILEPYWNMSRIDQIIARGIRYKSHEMLPLKEREVDIYIYLSVYPKNIEKKVDEYTTDVSIWKSAINNKVLIDEFLQAMYEVSIECAIFNDEKDCKMCNPNNEILFFDDYRKDVFKYDTCKPLKQEAVKVKEIIVDDKKYYYYVEKKDSGEVIVHLIVFDEEINGYIEIYPDKDTNHIINKIYEFEKLKPRNESLL